MLRKWTSAAASGPVSRPAHGAVAILAAALLPGCLAFGDRRETVAVPVDEPAALAAVNAFRAENGLRPVASDPRLMAAAGTQSEAMAVRDDLDHAVAGNLPGRLDSAGYRWSATAENIGRGYGDHATALRGWIGSPSHRRNLLNPAVTDIGFAAARDTEGGRIYWTQIFAAPKKQLSASSTVQHRRVDRWRSICVSLARSRFRSR